MILIMEDFFYFNISNNESLKKEIDNVLFFLEQVNKKINYTKINIRDKESELLKFLLNKFKKLYLFQFMLNPNEDIQNALNNSLILLFNEVSNNLNYNSDVSDNSNYLEILKNKSIYKFLEELEENKDNEYNSTTRRLLELNKMDIDYLKSSYTTNNKYLSYLSSENKTNKKRNKINLSLNIISLSFILGYITYKYIKS